MILLSMYTGTLTVEQMQMFHYSVSCFVVRNKTFAVCLFTHLLISVVCVCVYLCITNVLNVMCDHTSFVLHNYFLRSNLLELCDD